MALEFIIPDWAAPPGVRALQTLRPGGISTAPWASFNLGMHVGDDPRRVTENRLRLATHLPAMPHWLNQVHGTTAVDLGKIGETTPEADAAFTRAPGVVCAVMTADCLPILLCDDAGSVVAAIHAGWRGLVDGVVEKTVLALGVPGHRLMAWLGPAIGPGAFEVGDDVRARFMARDPATESGFTSAHPGKWLADLYALACLFLGQSGVSRISGGSWCTVSDADRFFSYRRDGQTGRMATLVWLEDLSKSA